MLLIGFNIPSTAPQSHADDQEIDADTGNPDVILMLLPNRYLDSSTCSVQALIHMMPHDYHLDEPVLGFKLAGVQMGYLV